MAKDGSGVKVAKVSENWICKYLPKFGKKLYFIRIPHSLRRLGGSLRMRVVVCIHRIYLEPELHRKKLGARIAQKSTSEA
jgi:hypothetical protein